MTDAETILRNSPPAVSNGPGASAPHPGNKPPLYFPGCPFISGPGPFEPDHDNQPEDLADQGVDLALDHAIACSAQAGK